MGNCCLASSEYEAYIDDVFKSLLSKGIKLEKLIEELDKKKNYIVETDFQVIINQYLLTDEYKIPLYNYWIDFHKKKPVELQIVFIKISFYFLFCKDKIKAKLDVTKLFKNYRDSKEDSKNDKMMRIEDIIFIIREYLYSISYLTIEHFRVIHSKPLSFHEKLQSMWDVKHIEGFVNKHFFSTKESGNTKIDVEAFINQNIVKLMDSFQLRKLLSDYSIRNSQD
jgi:hypothetical protein